MENSSAASPRGFFGPDSKAWTALFLAAFGFLVVFFCRGINVPWVENDNYYGAIYAQAAHNNLRAGLAVTGAVPATLYFGPLPLPVDAYYVHHPTLLPLLTTASFTMFGESEWATRLVPVVCSLLSMIFLWFFVADAVNRRAAAFACVILATLPMELHYGDMVDFEPCLVMLMLAALVCLRHWHKGGKKIWAWLTALCCLLAVNMDWPGYLFVMSVGNYHLLKGPRRNIMFALGLYAACAISGITFLLQIRHVNPGAWSDLWTALTMRLGNGTATGSSGVEIHNAHFTFAQWCGAVRRALHNDFLVAPWLLAGAGAIFTAMRCKSSEGMRAAGWGTLHMLFAGVVYVVVLRNESYIHDFTTFYLIGAVAVMGGICLEAVFAWAETKMPAAVAMVPVLALFGWLGFSGYRQAESMRSQFGMLDGMVVEPENLIPDMGRKLAGAFPPETTILCNFDPYASVLPYYTQRTILTNLAAYDDWKSCMAQGAGPYGGIIWLDAPHASEILNELPKEEITAFEIDGFRFAIWKPSAAKPAP